MNPPQPELTCADGVLFSWEAPAVPAHRRRRQPVQRVNVPTPGDQMLVSVSRTASRLGVSVPTIRRWIRDGTLVAYKLGGQIRVKVADIEALLEAARIDPHVAPSPAPRALRAPAAGGLREMLHL